MQSLGIEPVRDAQLDTAGGDLASEAYAVRVHLGWQQDLPPDPIPLIVYRAELDGVDVLVGLDVIRHGKLVVDGLKGEYELLLPRTVRPIP